MTTTESVKAKALHSGDLVLLKGQRWTVAEACRLGDLVRLTVSHPHGGVFSKGVPKGQRFDRLIMAEPPAHAAGVDSMVTDGLERLAEATARVEEVLGARPLYDERLDANGQVVEYRLPPVDEQTVGAHLYVFHGATMSGVSLAEARRVVPHAESRLTPDEALRLADFEAAIALHDALHAEGPPPVPHRHVEPAQEDE